MNKLNFATAGIPYGTPKPNTVNGVKYLPEVGLDAMEIQFTHGINLTPKSAELVKQTAKESNVLLTCHAPYYINLNSTDPKKIEASKQRILKSAKIANMAGAWSVCFHPAYYGKSEKQNTYNIVKLHLKEIVEELKAEKNKIWIRPETMGKNSQFGDIDEIIKLSQELSQVLPCIDFSHIFAKSLGKQNTKPQFTSILEKVEKQLGKTALKNMHIHMSGIAYGQKGERNHLMLKDSEFNYRGVLSALKDFNTKGILTCESPITTKDALLLKETYTNL